MKKRCKNCVHRSWTIEGDSYCDKNNHYTNEDGCCSQFKKDALPIIVCLCVAVLGIIIFLLKSIANG